jgi:hypothetical protein
MKLTTGILAIAITMMAGAAYGQNADAIDNARSVAKSLQQKQANDNASKPAPGAPAPAVKPAVIPGAQPVAAPAPAAKPASAAKPAAVSGQNNQLRRVNVVPGADNIQVEISSTSAVTPRVSKLDSPSRILVELPGTIDTTPKNHIPVGTGGVKGVRIGMDGKTPPTTSVVVDLEKACAYDLTPGPADKLVLTLHVQGVAKSNPAPAVAPAIAKTAPAPVPAVAKTAPAPVKAQPIAAKPAAPAKPVVAANAAPKPPEVKNQAKPEAKNQAKTEVKNEAKPEAKTAEAKAKDTKAAAAPAPSPAPAEASKSADAAKPQPKPEDKKWAMNGKRDPFFSPVVQVSSSGCSTGKKCLEIGNINLRGVVKSDSGFIAVVTNNLNKAYFLRENDPVFNGYVLKITGDSVVFQETVEDKLGKPFTREVVKRIFTPAV